MRRARRNWEGVASDLTTDSELRHSVLRGKRDETRRVFPDLITELRPPGNHQFFVMRLRGDEGKNTWYINDLSLLSVTE